jgi:hypothetical protein
MDMAVGKVPWRTRYPPTPPTPVEGVQLRDTELEVTPVTTRLVGTEGAVISMVSTTNGGDLEETLPMASKATKL